MDGCHVKIARLIILPTVLSFKRRRPETQTVAKNDEVNWAYLRGTEQDSQVMSFGKERDREVREWNKKNKGKR